MPRDGANPGGALKADRASLVNCLSPGGDLVDLQVWQEGAAMLRDAGGPSGCRPWGRCGAGAAALRGLLCNKLLHQ